MMDQIIREIRARPVLVPLEYPVKTAVGIVAVSPLVLVDLVTSSGLTGHAYLFAYIPAALKPLACAVEELGRLIVGQPVAPVDIARMLEQRLRLVGNTGLLGMASAGLDMAAWDALAKHHELPLACLLGGTVGRVRAYDSHAMDGIELAAERAARAAEAGFAAIKTKIGYASVAEDVAVIRSIRKATSDRIGIMVDYNQSLTVPEAIARGRVLDDEEVAWIEEPTLQQDYAGHARIGAAIRTPVQIGENWFGPDEMAKSIAAGASALGMADVMKIGGVTGWLAASALATRQGLPLSSHLFQEISAHLLRVTPTCHWLERLDIASPVLAEKLVFEDGSAVIPDNPGTGIAWDEAAVERYRA